MIIREFAKGTYSGACSVTFDYFGEDHPGISAITTHLS